MTGLKKFQDDLNHDQLDASLQDPAQSSHQQSEFDENKKNATEEKEKTLQTKLSRFFTPKK